MVPRSKDSTLWMREKRSESLRKCQEILKFELLLFVKIHITLFYCDMLSLETNKRHKYSKKTKIICRCSV